MVCEVVLKESNADVLMTLRYCIYTYVGQTFCGTKSKKSRLCNNPRFYEGTFSKKTNLQLCCLTKYKKYRERIRNTLLVVVSLCNHL